MFTFGYQFIDLVTIHTVGGFMVFFIASWFVQLRKWAVASEFVMPTRDFDFVKRAKIHVIVPVVDEPAEIWTEVLTSLQKSLDGINHSLVVVANGSNAIEESKIASEMGIEVIRYPISSKRQSLKVGYRDSDITVILDSDTIVSPDSISTLVSVFSDPSVGGATPRHMVFNREGSIFRRISDWLEDIRFNDVVAGQSVDGAISCLPGRLLAIRTDIFKDALEGLVNQTFLGSSCISGDDRYLTSHILKNGYKTAYVPDSFVFTDCPSTLGGFVKQRLRWSRTSLRETILSLGWIFNHPFLAMSVLSNVVFRWWFFALIVNTILTWSGVITRPHYLQLELPVMATMTALGWMLSGYMRQYPHLARVPEDKKYLLPFLVVTTFILTPVEWFGNLTLRESGWMTRRTE